MKESKIKVLVVDDEKVIRDFFTRLLTLQGLEVVEAAEGSMAIELSMAGSFDLYFIDVRMPGLNGLETYRKIHELHPQSCVVMMTGYAVDEILEQAKQEGVSGVIRKPFAIDEIRDIVSKVAGDGKGGILHILVVDDDEAVLSFFSHLLEGRTLKYKIARSKNEALAAVRNERFDAVFLDLVLKDSDGLSLYKEIKEITPDISVMVMTGHIEKAKELEDAHAIPECFYKPFEIDKIVEYIEKVKASRK